MTTSTRTPFVYLDHAATSWPKKPIVGEAMVEFLAHKAGNPGRGGHTLARAASETIERARERIGELINAPCSKRVVLTHGCTDSLNLAIHGVIRAAQRAGCEGPIRIVTTVLEHNAVLRTLHCYEADNAIELVMIGCDQRGRVNLDELKEVCTPCTAMVCLTHASNAMGTIQPIEEAIGIVRSASEEALMLVDCAQTLGHIAVDVQAMDIDLLAIAGHKGLGGPTGTGALYLSCRAYPDCSDSQSPRIFCERRGGTGQKAPGLEMPTALPDALEAGTSNAVGFAGLLAAMDALDPMDHEHEMMLTGQIIDGLNSIEGVHVLGMPGVEGRTPVVLFVVDHLECRAVADVLDREYNIACRAGSHCAPLAHIALGNGESGGIRVSPGAGTTSKDIERFIEAMREIATRG
ncbi:MAG: aminotransferase class V-fold PLP-dependent enzyme [Phycisphaerales bacterium]